MLLGPILNTLSVLTLLSAAAALALAVGMLVPGFRIRVLDAAPGGIRAALALAATAATAATVGSLYLSEGVGLMPCEFCWYQRIAMYPLAVILGVAAWRMDTGIWRYALPLSVVGLAIAVYHTALQWQPALSVKECTTAVPCTQAYFRIFGFVSIPVMASGVFLLVSVLLLAVAGWDLKRRAS